MAFSVEDTTAKDKREWIPASGATSHMTGHIDNLVDVHTLDTPRLLTVASGETMLATAVGKAPLLCNGREVCVLQDILYVHGLARNLVSVAAASHKGMEISFKGVSCVIRARSDVALKASRANHHMYVDSDLSGPIDGAAMMTAKAPRVETWYGRLGHHNTHCVQQVFADLKLPCRGVIEQACARA